MVGVVVLVFVVTVLVVWVLVGVVVVGVGMVGVVVVGVVVVGVVVVGVDADTTRSSGSCPPCTPLALLLTYISHLMWEARPKPPALSTSSPCTS